MIDTVAGTYREHYDPTDGVSIGDGGLAVDAYLVGLSDVALGPDNTLYIHTGDRIRRVDGDGVISTVAGKGGYEHYVGDGGPAVDASLGPGGGIAVGPDGSLYIVDSSLHNNRVWVVGPDGIIHTIAGTGQLGSSGDGGPAVEASFSNLGDVAVGPDGALFIVDGYQIRRVRSDGVIETVAGNRSRQGYEGDGGPATDALLMTVRSSICCCPDGSLYIGDGNRVRVVGTDGVIRTVAGNGSAGFSGDGGPAIDAAFSSIRGVAVDSEGALYISDSGNSRIRRVSPSLPGSMLEDIHIPSADGSEVYHFTGSGKHLRTLDALTGAMRYSFEYDDQGKLAAVKDYAGNRTTIEHDGDGNPTTIVGPYGQRTTLSVDANGDLTSIVNPAGVTWRFDCTSDGLMTAITDPKGEVFRYRYDADRRLTRTENPASGSLDLIRTETEQGFEVEVTTAEARTTRYREETLPSGEVVRINRTPDGLETRVEANGATQTITYANGFSLTQVQGPDPRFGMLAPVTTSLTLATPAGPTFTIEGSLTAELNNPADLLSLKTLTHTETISDRTTTSVYDAVARTVTVTSPAGRQAVATLNEAGRLKGVQVADLEPLTVFYDDFGRLQSLTTGSGDLAQSIRLSYHSDSGYLDRVVDPLAGVWSFLRDAAGGMTTVTRPDLEQIGFTYDDNSNVESVTPPGSAPHLFTYTALDALETYNPPDLDGVPTPFGYSYTADAELNVITRADGGTIDLDYDPASGYLSRIIWPGSFGETTFGYEATTGLLTSMVAPDGESLAFVHDGFLPERVSWSGTVSGAVDLGYDAELRVARITVQVGADERSWSYLYADADGLLTQAGDLTMTRDIANGFLTGTTLGSVTTSQAYTSFGEVARLSTTFEATGLYEVEFLEHDALGRVVRMQETVEGVTQTWQYVYDKAERLDQVWLDGSLYMDHDYDANGNRIRTEYAHSGQVIAATYDAQDRIKTWGNVSYELDANGSLLSRTSPGGTATYDYDAQGALRSVRLPSGQTIGYAIDPSGRRVGKSINGSFDRGWLYQDGLNPVAELDSRGNLRAVFVYGSRPHVPDYMVADGTSYRLVTDLRGSVRLVVDTTTGAVAQRLDYDAWGRVVADTNPGFQPFGYAGGLYDPDTGLVRFGARDYDAEVGRWTARDRVLFKSTESNLYSYVTDDPINWIDPAGNLAVAIVWGIAEVGFTVVDITSCISTLFFDPCASTADKIICVVLTGVGIALPAGGLAAAAKFGPYRAVATVAQARRRVSEAKVAFDALGRDLKIMESAPRKWTSLTQIAQQKKLYREALDELISKLEDLQMLDPQPSTGAWIEILKKAVFTD
jgi:RHS repeat-associated protein